MIDAAVPFLTAIRFGSLDSVSKILSDSQDVDVRDQPGMTALHWSIYQGKIEVACLLIAHGAKVEATDASGETPLHFGAAR